MRRHWPYFTLLAAFAAALLVGVWLFGGSDATTVGSGGDELAEALTNETIVPSTTTVTVAPTTSVSSSGFVFADVVNPDGYTIQILVDAPVLDAATVTPIYRSHSTSPNPLVLELDVQLIQDACNILTAGFEPVEATKRQYPAWFAGTVAAHRTGLGTPDDLDVPGMLDDLIAFGCVP